MSISSVYIPLAKKEEDNEHEVQIELAGYLDSRGAEIERFIQVIFRRVYGAKIRHFLPYLLSMKQNDKTLAALGIRRAGDERLFLELYLNRPIENVLAEKLARPIDRERVVEVGNLVSAQGGGARALIVTLAAYLSGARYKWAVFTATSQVRNNFSKLGIDLTFLADADKARLGESQKDWGTYYEQQPQVVAVSVEEAARAIQRLIDGEKLFSMAGQVWQEAFRSGRQGILLLPPCKIGLDIEDEALI